jgi:hypothetical protein
VVASVREVEEVVERVRRASCDRGIRYRVDVRRGWLVFAVLAVGLTGTTQREPGCPYDPT